MQALDNLAMAAMSDRDIVAQLTASNTLLAEANKALTDQLQVQTDTNAALIKQLRPSTHTSCPVSTHDNDRQKKYEARLDPAG